MPQNFVACKPPGLPHIFSVMIHQFTKLGNNIFKHSSRVQNTFRTSSKNNPVQSCRNSMVLVIIANVCRGIVYTWNCVMSNTWAFQHCQGTRLGQDEGSHSFLYEWLLVTHHMSFFKGLCGMKHHCLSKTRWKTYVSSELCDWNCAPDQNTN